MPDYVKGLVPELCRLAAWLCGKISWAGIEIVKNVENPTSRR